MVASARACSTEKQTRPGRGFLFPSRQRGKFKEASSKLGTVSRAQPGGQNNGF